MHTLNLTFPEKGQINFQIYHFPDGQKQVKILDSFDHLSLEKIETLDVMIKSRMNSWLDLELIACTASSLRDVGFKNIHLFCPMILGSRSDTKFEKGSNNYLKHVICPHINLIDFKSVTVIDPHSIALEMGLDHYIKQDNTDIVKFAINDICPSRDLSNIILISPDGGALKKIYKVAEEIKYDGEVITCSKSRGVDGKLSKSRVPLEGIDFFNKNLVIVDDICDGGKTFIEIAKKIREDHKETFKGKIFLVITHMIHQKPSSELFNYFDGIYCTNSRHDTFESPYPLDILKMIKVLNIF